MLMVEPVQSSGEDEERHDREIAEQPLIFPKTGFMRQIHDKQFRPFRSRLHVTMELPSVGMIKRFVAAGLGVSLISESFVRDEVRAGKGETHTRFRYGRSGASWDSSTGATARCRARPWRSSA